jgi:L-ascorbate metabolism protein UlaG (beta-lactamase superfamily)
MRLTYIGHATLLLELAGVRLLTDPNFDPKLGGFLRRVSAPGIALDALPALDAILLTHAHADHLSFASLDALPRDIPLYAPPAVERWLKKRGYAHAVPLAPSEEARVGDVRVHAASAKHLGARYGVDRWRSAANMYLLDAGRASVFFAGDTALTPDSHRMVHDRLTSASRRLDVALLPIGHAPWWKPGFRDGHLTSADALTLFDRLGARFMIPYHWGTFNHVTSSAHDAIEVLRGLLPAHARAEDVRIVEPGGTFDIPLDEQAH